MLIFFNLSRTGLLRVKLPFRFLKEKKNLIIDLQLLELVNPARIDQKDPENLILLRDEFTITGVLVWLLSLDPIPSFIY